VKEVPYSLANIQKPPKRSFRSDLAFPHHSLIEKL
jgi:hypothetical protein